MLDTETKNRIQTARDILVGKVPDPKSQVEQITIALIYKFMDDMDVESEELGGKRTFFTGEYAKYAWRKIFDPRQSGYELLNLYSEAITKMDVNPGIPKLFRDIFKNAYLPYRDPETLKSFLKVINEFDYSHSEKLGDAFEFLLSVLGSQGDAGQFRTPRHIIDFMVEIVDPKKNETILDPACGTAGFLISSYKHIIKHNSSNFLPDQTTRDTGNGTQSVNERIITSNGYSGDKLTADERKVLADNLHGYDISPDMVRLSLVNMYLHGIKEPHISEYDTLTSEDNWNHYSDVILANPPFMSPKGGIRPHKRFSVQSNRSEVLFVDYIAEHLTPDGRAAVIVPEGIIFQSGKAYKQLRKMLVEQYLVGVISLPAGVFNPYAGVKTSILWIDKALAKKTNRILFVKIENDGFDLGAQRRAIKENDLPYVLPIIKDYVEGTNKNVSVDQETFKNIFVVGRDEILSNSEYQLTAEKYKRKEIRNTKFPLVAVDNAVENVKYTNKIKTSDFLLTGKFPVIDQGEAFISGYWDDEKDLFKIKQPVTIFGDHTRCFKYVDFDFVLGADGIKILQPKQTFNPKFFYYIIRSVDLPNLGYSRHYKELREKLIPMPPAEIQEEIIAEIESYQKIIDGARMVVENYKPRIEIDPEWEMVELGEVCEIKAGGTPLRSNMDFWEGRIPWYSSGELNESYTLKPKEFITEQGLENSNATLFPKGSLLIGMYDTAAFKMSILDREATFNQAVCGVKPNNDVDLYFLMLYFLMNKDEYLSHRVGVRQRNLNKGFIAEIKIPKIPLEPQKQIVAQIKTEQEYVNASKRLATLFEQKINDRIAKLWGE